MASAINFFSSSETLQENSESGAISDPRYQLFFITAYCLILLSSIKSFTGASLAVGKQSVLVQNDMNEENAKFRKVYLVTGSHSELASEEVNLDTVDDFDPHLVM